MKQIDNSKDVSHKDLEKISAKLSRICQASTDLYAILAISLGKNHPYTQRARTIHKKSIYLCLNVQRLAAETTKGKFSAKEFDNLFSRYEEPEKY